MKRLSDLTDYLGVLPYASELFGIYQPLLGWKSRRAKGRVARSAAARARELVVRLNRSLSPDWAGEFDSNQGLLTITHIAPARAAGPPRPGSIMGGAIALALQAHPAPSPALWDEVLAPPELDRILHDHVVPAAAALYTGGGNVGGAGAEAAARSVLESESRAAGVLALLRDDHDYDFLASLFYGKPDVTATLLASLVTSLDPFETIDPTKQLDRVALSPVGIAHLFREYFFELDTLLGPPVGHVWLSPGATVELVEVHTRRVLVEQTLEQSLESITKREKSLTQQDDLSDAVKEENRTDMKLGVNISANQRWGWGSAAESASFDLATGQQRAREQTHRTMRQQTEKLSTEIKENFRTTFRTVTETSDMSSKRYVLVNGTDELVNYELRRKYRQVAVQVQDIGTYLCWQSYVDDPGASLGVARMVHLGVPPDLSKIPQPELVVPAAPFTEDLQLTIPFINLDKADNDETYEDGEDDDDFSSNDHIVADIGFGPVRCPQAAFKLAAVGVDVQGADAVITVDPGSIKEEVSTPGAFTFVAHLKHINFGGRDSIPIKATLHWQPVVDHAAIDAENKKRLATFTAREEHAFRASFVEVARERIKLASNIQPRRSADLREEERVVVYRALIQDVLAPESLVPRPDEATHHVVSELINSIFDVEKLLYFVSPEWWRPRLHRSAQQLGGIEPVVDVVTGKPVAFTPTPPREDLSGWGEIEGRADNYYITEESRPARLGSSLGWLLQVDGDDMRSAFLNAPWVKAVLPIRPGRERAAINWLKHVEGLAGIASTDMYTGTEPGLAGKTLLEVLEILADRVRDKHEEGILTASFPDPMDRTTMVRATPVDRVFEHGFDPVADGFRAEVTDDFEVFDQWIEVLPTDQVAAVEVAYDPKTGRQK